MQGLAPTSKRDCDTRAANDDCINGGPRTRTKYSYDAAGRKLTEVNDTRQVSYLYDEAGNRARTTWPDLYFVSYQYDALNRMQYVRENSTSANELAFYDYDILSRRKQLKLAGVTTNRTDYDYEADSDLDLITQTLNATTVTLDYGRNHSHQITSIAANDDFYLPKPATASTAYTANALNQYSAVGSNSPTYDANGNLLTFNAGGTYGVETLTYDSENRPTSVALNGSSSATISYDYDALGRRASKTVSGTLTSYLLDGDEEIAEYNSSGVVLRRYVTGPAIDDRIAHIEGSSTSPAATARTYYHTNHQGSVVAMTDNSGNLSGGNCGTQCVRLGYDEYGRLNGSAGTSGEAYRYTGRRFDAESGLYYYRARYYSPDLGRFLQVDPIGYKDDVNLYAYVGNDPANGSDPSGKDRADDLQLRYEQYWSEQPYRFLRWANAKFAALAGNAKVEAGVKREKTVTRQTGAGNAISTNVEVSAGFKTDKEGGPRVFAAVEVPTVVERGEVKADVSLSVTTAEVSFGIKGFNATHSKEPSSVGGTVGPVSFKQSTEGVVTITASGPYAYGRVGFDFPGYARDSAEADAAADQAGIFTP